MSEQPTYTTSTVKVQSTPSQPEMVQGKLEGADEDAAVAGVHVEMSKEKVKTTTSAPLPLQANLAHLLALVVTSIIALFVAAVLADGRSVVVLKPVKNLPRLTAYKYKKDGLDYRADELLGPSYGVGLHHDSSGYTWTEAGAGDTLQKYIDELGVHQVIAAVPSVIATDGLKHPVHFLSCHELQKATLSAMGLACIAEVAAALMIAFHGLALLGLLGGLVRAKYAKAFAALVWFILTAGFLIVIGLALGIMEAEWTCDNIFIPSIKLSDHFSFSYGIGFGYAGYVCSCLVFLVMLVFTSSTDGVERPANARESLKVSAAKVGGGLFIGLIVCVVVSLAVAGGEGAFEDDKVDDSINYCAGQKPYHAGPGDKYFTNVNCTNKEGIVVVLEQAGANVTRGYVGDLDAGEWRVPITKPYDKTDLCPVNVHWHLGAEHLSVGEFDEFGTGPNSSSNKHAHRQLAGKDERLGFRCHHYEASDPKFTTPYKWKHCDSSMLVGETYEVHWPHSAAGACGTKWQYQTPFYDGVFCKDGIINILTPLNTYKKIGVQSQTFVIVNDVNDDKKYYNKNLFDGMITDQGDFGADIAMYTGSTTGTSRDNMICSRYAPITWQVDRKCHMISASSFDEMCKRMKEQEDDMSGDLYAHGARELVDDRFVANNQQSRK